MKTGSGKASRRERHQRAKDRKTARIGIGTVAIAIAATPSITTFATRALPTERSGNHAGCLRVFAAAPVLLCSEDCGYTAMLRLAQEQSSWRQRRVFGALDALEEAPLPVAAVSVGPFRA